MIKLLLVIFIWLCSLTPQHAKFKSFRSIASYHKSYSIAELDLNQDRIVDYKDVDYLKKIYIGKAECNFSHKCDFSKNNKLDILDLSVFKNIIFSFYDINNDFKIDQEDELQLLLIALNDENCPIQRECDFNGDKTIDALDVEIFKNAMLIKNI